LQTKTLLPFEGEFVMLKGILSLFAKQYVSHKSMSKVYSVAVYKSQVEERLLFNPLAQHTSGGSVATNKTIILTNDFEPGILGETLKHALKISETLDKWDGSLKDDLIQGGKVKNRSQFVRKFSLVSVTYFADKGIIKLTVNKKYKSSGFIAERNDPVFELSVESTDADLGNMLLQAFDLCI
jgi:hypothetical protein